MSASSNCEAKEWDVHLLLLPNVKFVDVKWPHGQVMNFGRARICFNHGINRILKTRSAGSLYHVSVQRPGTSSFFFSEVDLQSRKKHISRNSPHWPNSRICGLMLAWWSMGTLSETTKHLSSAKAAAARQTQSYPEPAVEVWWGQMNDKKFK